MLASMWRETKPLHIMESVHYGECCMIDASAEQAEGMVSSIDAVLHALVHALLWVM